MFVLVTGAPGASKTSNVIARFMKETGRPIYYRGIRDLTLSWNELTDEQTLDWPNHVPEGAILIVDEAQQLWPVRPSSKPVPAGLTALETHRHKGWDVWFITQEPSLLDSHARKLANEHFHYVRPFGAPFVVEYHSGSGAVSVGSSTDLNRCNKTKKALPKAAWGAYKSAEVHTHKFRPPKIVYLLIALIIIAPFAWWNFFRSVGEMGGVAPGQESGPATQAPAPAGAGSGGGQPRRPWRELLTPEIAGLPFTAPLYDDIARKPTAAPMLAGCVVRQRELRDCTCYTQQGTVIADAPWSMCMAFIKGGMFNHLASEQPSGRRGDAADAGGAPRAGASGDLAGGPSAAQVDARIIGQTRYPRLNSSIP